MNYEFGYSFEDDLPASRWFQLGGLGRLSAWRPTSSSDPRRACCRHGPIPSPERSPLLSRLRGRDPGGG